MAVFIEIEWALNNVHTEYVVESLRKRNVRDSILILIKKVLISSILYLVGLSSGGESVEKHSVQLQNIAVKMILEELQF